MYYFFQFRDTVEVAGDHAIIFTDSGRETHGLFDAYEGPLFCDGTFKVTPPLFDSLITVHLQRGNHVFPLFYALLTSRTQQLYVACLSRMKQSMDGITITSTMTDYEIGLMNACREVFDCPSHGCWFHYSQALLKRVRKIGLLGAFHRNSDLKRFIHQLMTLALLPAENVEATFDELRNQRPRLAPDTERKLSDFLRYYERYWLRKITPARLSVFGLPQRTNNSVESFHAVLKRKMGHPHPNFFVFLDILNKLIQCKLNDLSLLTNGEEIARRRSVLQITNERRLAVLGEQLTGQQIAPLAFVKRACAFIRRYAEDHVETSESQTDEDGNADGPREGNPDREPETDEENVNHQDDQDDNTDRSSSPTRAPDNSCPVCLLNPRNAVFVPCGHALCYDCGVHVQGDVAPNNRCHCCRADIASVVRVFGMA